MAQTWRERYRPIIARVIREHGGQETRELRKALSEAFPDPPREHYPYRIWLDEIRRQLQPPAHTNRLDAIAARPDRIEPLPNQRQLFPTTEP